MSAVTTTSDGLPGTPDGDSTFVTRSSDATLAHTCPSASSPRLFPQWSQSLSAVMRGFIMADAERAGQAIRKSEKPDSNRVGLLWRIIPAASYSPTESPLQYH